MVEPENETTPATIRARTYTDLTDEEKIRESVDIKATNIVLQGLPHDIYNLVNHNEDTKQIWDRVKLLIQGSELSLQERESKLYDDFDTFTSMLGETIHSYYMWFAQLINDMHTIGTDIAKISRKRLKPDKHGHGNGRAHKEPGECYQKSTVKAPTLYDSHTIVKTHAALSVTDTEETLELAEESRLSEHFAKYFVPQEQLSAE
ncbi:hypothetical protein Tco_0944063 [Tanacetum coccineum]